MPEGQFLGDKAIYVYKDDTDVDYIVKLDKTLGEIPELGMQAAVSADLTKPTLPSGFKMRRILWSGLIGGKVRTKRLVCSRTSTAYAATGSTEFNISDSTQGATTGRTGEKKTYIRLNSAVSGPAAP